MLTRFKKIARKYLHRCSGGKKQKHVCFIFKGKNIKRIGYNSLKTHTRSNTPFKTLHAETHAILRAGNCRGYDAFVLRVSPENKIRLSRPCCHCLITLYNAGIRKIWYTTDIGGFELYEPTEEEDEDPN